MLAGLMSLIFRYVLDLQETKIKVCVYLYLVEFMYIPLSFFFSYSGSNPKIAKTSYRNGKHLLDNC